MAHIQYIIYDMKVLVLSDSHGQVQTMIDLFYEDNYRAIIFLGDVVRDTERLYQLTGGIPVYRVKGNCDLFENAPEEQIIDIGGKLLLITHGHRYGVKSGYGSFENAALAAGVDAALCGHTHRQFYERLGNVIIANPGSVAAGNYGVLTIDKNIEFELRSIYD